MRWLESKEYVARQRCSKPSCATAEPCPETLRLTTLATNRGCEFSEKVPWNRYSWSFPSPFVESGTKGDTTQSRTSEPHALKTHGECMSDQMVVIRSYANEFEANFAKAISRSCS